MSKANESRFPRDSDLVPHGVDTARKFAAEWAAAAVGIGEEERDPRAVFVRCLRQGWGQLRYGRSIVNEPLKLADKVFEHGLGTHADSDIRIRANQSIRAFRAWAGLDNNGQARSYGNQGAPERLLFSVEASGR